MMKLVMMMLLFVCVSVADEIDPMFWHATAAKAAICGILGGVDPSKGGGWNGPGFYVTPRITNYIKNMAFRHKAADHDGTMYIAKLKADNFWAQNGCYINGFMSTRPISGDGGWYYQACDYIATRWDYQSGTLSMRSYKNAELPSTLGARLENGPNNNAAVHTDLCAVCTIAGTPGCALTFPKFAYTDKYKKGEAIEGKHDEAGNRCIIVKTSDRSTVAKAAWQMKKLASLEAFDNLYTKAKAGDNTAGTGCQVLDTEVTTTSARMAYLKTISELALLKADGLKVVEVYTFDGSSKENFVKNTATETLVAGGGSGTTVDAWKQANCPQAVAVAEAQSDGKEPDKKDEDKPKSPPVEIKPCGVGGVLLQQNASIRKTQQSRKQRGLAPLSGSKKKAVVYL